MTMIHASRRDLLAAAVPLAIAATGARATAATSAATIDIGSRARFDLSPHLYMQFMEPLGTTDGSVEASWDHLTAQWRPDLIAATKRLAPPMLRWGGLLSAFYKWREGVGPREKRVPMHNLMWGGVETSQIGTDEFLDFCAQVSSEPLMCVNFGAEGQANWVVNALGQKRAGDAREAAEWVAYCNRPGRTSRLARPIRYWQIGNETSYGKGRFTRDVAVAKTIEFARAMRAVDPSLKLIAWGDSGWAPEMIAKAGQLVDMLAFHHLFDPGPACRDTVFRKERSAAWDALMASAATFERKITEMRATSGKTPLAMTEAHYQIGGRNRGDINATWAAGVAFARWHHIQQRHGDVLKIANIGDFCGNRWMTNVVMLPTPRGEAYLMPVGKVAAFYRQRSGDHSVAVSPAHPDLDIVASRTGSTCYVHVANTSLTETITAPLSVDRAAPRSVTLHQITADDPFAEIVSAKDDPMRQQTTTVAAGSPVSFPPASVSVVELAI